jgi:hypothetical protein
MEKEVQKETAASRRLATKPVEHQTFQRPKSGEKIKISPQKIRQRQDFFFFARRPDELWGPPNLLYRGYGKAFPRG